MPSRMRLLTYNIHGLPWCKINVPAMIDWIFNNSGAEIICLQEVFSNKHKRLFWKKAAQEGWTFLAPHDLIYGGFVPGLENGSGLITIIHPRFTVSTTRFEPYKIVNSVDQFVKKGFFTVNVSDGVNNFQVVNTHMQSDVTECCCIRVNFNTARHAQEEQLYLAMTRNELPLIIGDANTCIFKYFHRVDQATHATFPETEEHLDHLLCIPGDAGRVHHIDTIYHDDISLSDHIPVVYTINLLRKSNRH